jgi:hypothetical protein
MLTIIAFDDVQPPEGRSDRPKGSVCSSRRCVDGEGLVSAAVGDGPATADATVRIQPPGMCLAQHRHEHDPATLSGVL